LVLDLSYERAEVNNCLYVLCGDELKVVEDEKEKDVDM
jgi:hypothetical protein